MVPHRPGSGVEVDDIGIVELRQDSVVEVDFHPFPVGGLGSVRDEVVREVVDRRDPVVGRAQLLEGVALVTVENISKVRSSVRSSTSYLVVPSFPPPPDGVESVSAITYA